VDAVREIIKAWDQVAEALMASVDLACMLDDPRRGGINADSHR
jgi:hypothetical protein